MTRISPPESATQFAPGTRRQGIDGRAWRVAVNRAGVQRWVPVGSRARSRPKSARRSRPQTQSRLARIYTPAMVKRLTSSLQVPLSAKDMPRSGRRVEFHVAFQFSVRRPGMDSYGAGLWSFANDALKETFDNPLDVYIAVDPPRMHTTIQFTTHEAMTDEQIVFWLDRVFNGEPVQLFGAEFQPRIAGNISIELVSKATGRRVVNADDVAIQLRR